MAICYIGIGSNLGNRRLNIKQAVTRLKKLEGTRLLKVSRIIETEPVGGPCGQPKFLNAAAKIDTRVDPHGLLRQLKRIEADMGRKKGARNGPRIMDLDILFYGGRTVRTKDLTIPHPRVFERQFVLRPLSEVI